MNTALCRPLHAATARTLVAFAQSVMLCSPTTGAPRRRLVIAMPFGGSNKFSRTRALIKTGLTSGRVLVTAAAGNEAATSIIRPSAFPEVLAVGGVSTAPPKHQRSPPQWPLDYAQHNHRSTPSKYGGSLNSPE